MKTFAGCFLFVFYCSVSVSQNYVPFPDSNAVWRGESQYLDQGTGFWHSVQYDQYIDGDTTINAIIYHKLYETHIHYIAYIPGFYIWVVDSGTGYAGAFREDLNKRIYFLQSGQTNDTLLYDFNLQIGDTLPESFVTPSFAYVFVVGVDSFYDGNVFRKKYLLDYDTISSNNSGMDLPFLIEGIGSNRGFNATLTEFFEFSEALYCFRENNDIKYSDSLHSCSLVNVSENLFQKSVFTLSPNPATEILKIKSEKPIAFPLQLLVMDMQGKLMEEKIIYNNDDLSLNVKSFSNAPYFVVIKDNETVLFHSIFLKE